MLPHDMYIHDQTQRPKKEREMKWNEEGTKDCIYLRDIRKGSHNKAKTEQKLRQECHKSSDYNLMEREGAEPHSFHEISHQDYFSEIIGERNI